jgi:hypothetical protein
MNCTTVRQHLLASERPDRPPQALVRHLAGCSTCRGLHRRLVQLEQDIPRLRVPAPRPPAKLIDQVLNGPAPGQLISLPFRLRTNPDAVREGGRQKLALAFALAASLLVFALGWWAWPGPDVPRLSSPVRERYHRQVSVHLATARTPQEKVLRMAELADTFMKDVPGHRADPDRLTELAIHFEYLGRDLHVEALRVPLAEQVAVLTPVAARLRHLESQAERLAVEWAGEHADSARSLHRIAAAVRDTDHKLTEMIRRARA